MSFRLFRSIPPSYLHYLSYYVSASALDSSLTDLNLSRQHDLSSRFVSILLRQASEGVEEQRYASKNQGRETALTPRLNDFGISSSEKGKGRETDRRTTPMRFTGTPMSIDASTPSRDLDLTYEDDEEHLNDFSTFDRPVSVTSPPIFAPSLFDSAPSVQGPFLLSPAPEELDDDREATATDVAFTRVTTSNQEQGKGASKDVEVLIFANDNGRVDLCVVLEKVEARWNKKNKNDAKDKRKPGRYALVSSRIDRRTLT